MPGKDEIVAGIRLEGEKEFKSGVSDINRSIKTMNSELKLVTEQYKGQSNSLEALTAKQSVLNRILAEQEKKADATSKGLANANKNYEKAGEGVERLWKQMEKETDKLEELKKIYGETSSEALEQQKAVDQLSAEIGKQEALYRKAGNSVKDWEARLNYANAQVIKTNGEISETSKYMREAEQSTDGCAKSIDEFGRKIGKVETDTFWDTFKANLASGGIEKGLELAGQAADAVKESMFDLSSASADLAAKTGLSEEAMKRYRDVMTEIKGDNFGESYGDVADVMAEIVQIMGKMDPSAMKDTAESAMTLRDTFGMDVNESIRAVDVMVKTMGVDSQTAFDLIAKGAQNGLDRSHELTDNITEYGQLWGQAGFSAEEMFSILQNGLDAGAYNLDKVNDYVKEFGISLADGRMEKNLGKFSDGTQELFGAWKDGRASVRDVFFSVIGDLSEMAGNTEDAADAAGDMWSALGEGDNGAVGSVSTSLGGVKGNAQDAIALASEMWSALGEDNSMSVITALGNVNTEFSNVQGTMDELKETKYSDLESAVAQLGASIQENFLTPIAESALPLVTEAAELATGAVEKIGEMLSPSKDSVTQLLDTVKQANDELETSLGNAEQTVQDAELDAGRIEALGTQLMSLNSQEELSLGQKFRLKEIVKDLGESIPEVAKAYDEESGKVRLTNTEIQTLISSTKELMVAQAAQKAMQDVANKLMEAGIALENARTVKSAAYDRLKLLQDEKQLLFDLNDAYSNGEIDNDTFQTRQLEFWQKALDEGRISLDEFNDAASRIGEGQWNNAFDKNSAEIEKWEGNLKDASQETMELEQNMSDAEGEFNSYQQVVNSTGDQITRLTGATDENTDATSESARKAKERATALGVVVDESGEYTTALYEEKEALDAEGDAASEAAEKVRTGAETQKEAMQGVLDTYHGYVSEIESDMENKVSLFDKFDGGTDMTAEDMQENMQTYVDGIKKYQENLAYVKEQMGEDLSPEFLKYIEDMGLDAANLLEHYAITIRDQGEQGKEIIKKTSDEYKDYLNLTGEIAEAQAANRTAMDAYTRDLGSTTVEFDGLQESIDAAKESANKSWSGMSEETQAALDEVVNVARESGIKIPEGLAEGIANGEISPEQAVEQLTGALQGSFDGLAKVAEQAGLEVTPEIAAGIESGDPAQMAAALDRLISHITENADTEALSKIFDEAAEDSADVMESHTGDVETAGGNLAQAGADATEEKKTEYQSAGEASGDEYVSALLDKEDAAKDAGNVLGEAVVESIKEQLDAMQKAGEEMAAKYTAALESYQQQAAQAGGALGSAAYNAAASWTGSFYSVGTNMAAGIAQGIRDGGSSAIEAARSMASQALTAAKKELDIHSPSKKFRKEVGQNISESTAFGIRDKAALAGREAASMSAQVYSKATAWMSKYKKSHKISLDDEAYYWEQLLGHVKKGTDAYEKAAGRLWKIQLQQSGLSGKDWSSTEKAVSSSFGVSRSKTTGSGKNQKTVSKDAESYYSEVYSAAQKYFNNMQVLNDWDLSVQLEYWKSVRSQLGKGTQAWYDATKEIKSVKAEITESRQSMDEDIVSSSEEYIRKQKILGKMSTEDELAYWRDVLATVEKGKDAWYDAKENVLSLKEQVQQEREQANEDIIRNAEDYIRKQKILGKMSTEDELAYWEGIIKAVDAGTDPWYDAAEEIKELRESIEEEAQRAAEELAQAAEEAAAEAREAVENEAKEAEEAAEEALRTHLSVQQQLLARYKTYYGVSAKAEMQYWDTARKQFQEGTDERIEADQAYFDAREAYYDQLAELDEEYAEKKQKIDDDLAGSIKDLQDKYDDAVRSREQEIKSSMNLFEGWDAEGYRPEELLKNLKTQVEGLDFWEQQLEELSRKNLTEEFLEELRQMGPDAAANLWSLNQMTAEQLDEYQRLWNEKNNLAHKQALEDNEDLLKETQDAIADARKTAQDQIAQMEADYRSAIDELEADLSDGLRGLVDEAGDIGEDMIAALVAAINAGEADVAAAVSRLQEQTAQQQAAVKAQAEAAAQAAAQQVQQQAGTQSQPAQTPAQQEEPQPASAEQAQTEALSDAEVKKQLLAIIRTGTKRSKTLTEKEKEKYSTLWQRIAKNYGYSVGESQMKQIAALLGVKVSANITEDEKKKVRAAMAAKGYASGARNVWQDELAWILENAETEYVVRTADNAILQPMRAGDKVISPKGAENLYDFAEDPAEFISSRARDALAAAQAEMQKQQAAFRAQIPALDPSGIARLNRLMEQGAQPAPLVNVDTGGVVSLMQQMVSGMQAIMEQMQGLQSRQLYMDTGALVGALQQPLSRANAAVMNRKNRGGLR